MVVLVFDEPVSGGGAGDAGVGAGAGAAEEKGDVFLKGSAALGLVERKGDDIGVDVDFDGGRG